LNGVILSFNIHNYYFLIKNIVGAWNAYTIWAMLVASFHIQMPPFKIVLEASRCDLYVDANCVYIEEVVGSSELFSLSIFYLFFLPKYKDVILFAFWIQFDPYFLYCYCFFNLFLLFFSISFLVILFYLIFILNMVIIILIVVFFF